MSGTLAPQWLIQALTDAGAVASGAKLFSFIAGGGSVPSPLYADKALTTPLTNPYEFDSAGRGEFWLDESISYRLRLETAAGVLLWEQDSVEGAATASSTKWVKTVDLTDDTDPAKGAAIVGHRSTTLAKYADGVTYLCPEPLGTGMDDSLAIQTVLDLADSEGGGRVMLCAGRVYYSRFPLFVMGENIVFDLNGATIQSDMGNSATRSVGPIVQLGNCREWNRVSVDANRAASDFTTSFVNTGYADPSPGAVAPFNYPEDDGSWTVEGRNVHFVGNGAIIEFLGAAYRHGRYATQVSNCVDFTVSDYLTIGAGQAWGLGSDVIPNTPYAFRGHVWGVRATAPAAGYTYYANGFGGYGKYCTVRDCIALETEVPYRPPYYTTADWTTGETVAVDDLRKTEVYYYRATTPGVCGATPPTHSSGTVSDGAVDWVLAGRVVGQHGNVAAFSLMYDSHASNVGGKCGNWEGGNNQGLLMYVGTLKSSVSDSTIVGAKNGFASGNNDITEAESNLYRDCIGISCTNLIQITGKNCRHINVRGVGTRRSELNATNTNGSSCEFDNCDLDRILWPEYTAVSWTTGESVIAGDIRQNRGCSYVAATSGVTGATAPTHTSGSASDGTVTWDYSRSLADVFLNNRIRNGRTYTGAIQQWEASEFVAWGALRKNAAGDKIYIYTTAGTTGATEPSHTNTTTTQADGTARNLYFGVRRESLENIYFGWDRYAPWHTSLGSAGVSSLSNQNSVDLATYVGNTTFRLPLSQIGVYFLKAFTAWGTFAAGSLAAGSVVTINVYRRAGFTGNRNTVNFLLYTTTKSPASGALEDWSISKDSLPIVAWHDNQYSEIWMELVWTNPTSGSFLKNSRLTGLRR